MLLNKIASNRWPKGSMDLNNLLGINFLTIVLTPIAISIPSSDYDQYKYLFRCRRSSTLSYEEYPILGEK